MEVYQLIIFCAVVYVTSSVEIQQSHRDERFLLAVLRFRNGACNGTASTRSVRGVCLDRKECYLRGGTVAGSCAVVGVCCYVERTCYNSTALKVSYFVNPATFQHYCTYRVDVANRDVCQVRLDFETFQIAQPTYGPQRAELQGLGFEAFLCRNDTFTVTTPSATTASLGFTSICGSNDGQHIYIPVNTTLGGQSVSLNFQLADRTSGTSTASLLTPTWRIRVTQLECDSTIYDYSSFSSTITTLSQQHAHKHSLASNDFYLLAPTGCLQYYTERTGTYMSFNYNSGAGPYIGNMNYAICFRRTTEACGIRHSPQTFLLNYNFPMTSGTERDCDTIQSGLTSVPFQDYLAIPEGITVNGVTANKYCDSAFNSTNYVESTAPGPMYVIFHSDAYANINIALEQGFKIDYQILNSCT